MKSLRFAHRRVVYVAADERQAIREAQAAKRDEWRREAEERAVKDPAFAAMLAEARGQTDGKLLPSGKDLADERPLSVSGRDVGHDPHPPTKPKHIVWLRPLALAAYKA